MRHSVLTRFDSGKLLACLLFVAIFSLAAVPPIDSDLWWHLANGRLLVQLGAFPHTDLYSFSAVGHPWVMHEWLSDLVMYGLWRLGGLPLLVVVFGVAVTVGAGCLFTLLRWSRLHPTACVALTLLGALAGSTAWGSRPQVFNLLFTGLLLLGLQAFRGGHLRAWWLCPFLWLWANLHSGFLVGVIITGLFLAGQAIDAWRNAERMPATRLRALALALGVGLGLSLINPYGLDTLLFPLGTLTSPLIQNNIQEWASPDFHTMPGLLLEAIIFLVLLGLATGRVRASSSEWLWALALLYLALSSQRHVPLFVLAAAPLIGRCTQALLDWLQGLKLARRAGISTEQVALRWSPLALRPRPTSPALGLINLGLLAAVGFGMVSYRALPNIEPAQQAAAIAAAFPVKSAQALRDLGYPVRVFNYYDYGGYLVWTMYPAGSRVLIDGRVEVYGPQVFRDYLSVNYMSRSWQAVVARYHPDAILLPKAHPLVDLLQRDPGWSEVSGDPVAALFVPNLRGVRQ